MPSQHPHQTTIGSQMTAITPDPSLHCPTRGMRRNDNRLMDIGKPMHTHGLTQRIIRSGRLDSTHNFRLDRRSEPLQVHLIPYQHWHSLIPPSLLLVGEQTPGHADVLHTPPTTPLWAHTTHRQGRPHGRHNQAARSKTSP